MSEIGDAAVSYARDYGIAVFPLWPRAKEPKVRHGHKDATTDVDQIAQAWDYDPDMNIGGAMGQASGGVCVIDLDVDDDKGKDGIAVLKEWEREHGALPETATAVTGRGGQHLFYRFDGECRKYENEELAVDFRGDGSYAMLAPSVHPNGNAVFWDLDPEEYGIADADERVKAFVEWARPRQDKLGKHEKKVDINKDVRSGGRNKALYKALCSLQSQSWDDDAIAAFAETYNRMKLHPPLDEAEVQKTLNSALELEKGNPETANAWKQMDGADGPRQPANSFNHAKFADKLIEERHACYIDGVPSVWAGDHYATGWEAVEAAMIEQRRTIKQSQRREVRAYMALRMPRLEASSKRLVAFSNCVLDVLTTETMTPTPEHLITNVIPHRWNPDAECAAVDRTLMNIACGDADVFETLIEAIGLCMYRGCEFAKAPILIGKGSNGKSTYINMIRRVLGRENYSSMDMANIGERFQTVPLAGKLANLGDDISNEFISGGKGAVIKKIITGDEVSAEYKGGETFSFRPYCTLLFSVNEMPRLGDSSYGMMRRLMPIRFNADFEHGSEGFDPNIEEKLTTEAACERAIVLGVLGLQNCLSTGGVHESANSIAEQEAIRRENNSVLAYFDEADEGDLEGAVSSAVYARYSTWCKEGNLKPVSRVKFSRDVGEMFGMKSVPERVAGEVKRVYRRA